MNHVLNLTNNQLVATIQKLENEKDGDMRDYRAGYLNGLEMTKIILSDFGFSKENN